jgi:hypothetical protein
MAWAWFAIVQAVSLCATALGWVLLIPFCLAQAWTADVPDRWSFAPLNYVYGNAEDGVSGRRALIWGSGADEGKKVPYMPGAAPAWRAYCWSAWRNSAGNLKRVFAWDAGPFATFKIFGRTVKIGWQQETLGKVPVLSLS